MKDSRLIPVKVVQDEEFKNSFWSYDPEEVIEQASEVFEREFGIAGFRITQRKDWDSCGSEEVVNFPENLIGKIPDCNPEEASEFLLTEFKKEIKILSEAELRELFEFVDLFKEIDGRDRRINFLMSKLQIPLVMALLEDLIDFCKNKGSITVGFTGKILIANDSLKIGASTSPGENCILMGLCSDPKQAFLHVLGHLFGAEHSEQKRSIMYPETVEREQNYNIKDRQQIVKGIQRKTRR
ncbi:MAG: hypothetical protein V5A57_02785 [Candidatus Paceibacterota bacterium]